MQRVAILVLAVPLLAQPVRAQKPADVEKAILTAANAYRAKNGAGKLARDATLDAIAQKHAQALARVDKFGDNDRNGHILDGKDFTDRAKAGGYKPAYLAENVGWNKGFKDPAAKIMKDWIGSPPHRKNLVEKMANQTGIGAARGKSGRWYFVHLFGLPLTEQTMIKAALENRTKQTIKFTIGTKKYELKAGEKAVFTHSQPSGKVQISITWPNAKKAETSDLDDKIRYAFEETKKGGFEFKKVGAL